MKLFYNQKNQKILYKKIEKKKSILKPWQRLRLFVIIVINNIIMKAIDFKSDIRNIIF